MKTNDELLSLDNMGQGAAIEAFDLELKRVMANIMDVQTDAKAREVSLVVKITPSGETREFFGFTVQAKSKLRPRKEVVSRGIVGKEINGDIKARELFIDKQVPLFDDNVTPIRRAE